VLSGLDEARRTGFAEMKTNTVVLPENLDEVPAILDFALARGIEARFIERMPFGGGAGELVSMEEVRRRIEANYRLVPLPARPLDGPAARFRVEDRGMCGFISPVTVPFCARCNRIRLRADGHLALCIRGDETVDLRPALRPELQAGKRRDRGRRPEPARPAGISGFAAPLATIGG
jgi:cyclic pyranopterin phosphate synthase